LDDINHVRYRTIYPLMRVKREGQKVSGKTWRFWKYNHVKQLLVKF